LCYTIIPEKRIQEKLSSEFRLTKWQKTAITGQRFFRK
jgi:hypothetical protein